MSSITDIDVCSDHGCRCVKVRSPVKVTLFGEHAVVYGYPAIAVAVSKYIDFKICLCSGSGELRVRSRIGREQLVESAARSSSKEFSFNDRRLIYVAEAVNTASSELGIDVSRCAINVDINSDLPSGVGLGTSASVSSGIVYGVFKAFGRDIDPYTLASVSRNVEIKVQGAASPMDTGTVSLGGVVMVTPKLYRALRRLEVDKDLFLVVGYTPKRKLTYEMINVVRDKLSSIGRPIEMIFESIGEISIAASQKLINGDLRGLLELVNLNQKLLEALGVVIDETRDLVKAMLDLGVKAAKMSGGGGGGAVYGLVDSSSRAREVAKELETMGYAAFPATVSYRGTHALD